MKIYTVPIGLVSDLWAPAERLLARAFKFHPFLDSSGALRILLAGRADLILAVEDGNIVSAAIMEAIQYPTECVGNVLALAGERGVYREHMSTITDYLEQWSREHGCNKIGMVGRTGWMRFVSRRGWKTQPCLMASKEI